MEHNMILATHNSGTGEKPDNLFAKLFPCIAKCQKRCLLDQYKEGVRMFDIRVREYYGIYTIHHGLARYKMSLDEFLRKLDGVRKSLNDTSECIVMVTYEGKIDENDVVPFERYIMSFFEIYDSLTLGNISVKKPVWKTLYPSKGQKPFMQNYPKIVGWKVLFPFPRFWNMFIKKDVDTDGYVMEDFV